MGTFMEYFNAFWVGGLICALCQILLDRTKMLPGRIMVTLVCTGAVLSFLDSTIHLQNTPGQARRCRCSGSGIFCFRE